MRESIHTQRNAYGEVDQGLRTKCWTLDYDVFAAIDVDVRDARIPFLISASYPYPLKTIRIRIHGYIMVQLHRESKKFSPTISTVASTLVVRF